MSAAKTNQTTELELWNGHPSQWTAFKFYFMCLVLVALFGGLTALAYVNLTDMPSLEPIWYYPAFVIPIVLFIALIKYFIVRTTSYRLTDERLLVETGIFSRDSEEIELYRVRDWSVIKPFWLRITGRGHVRVVSTDATAPDLRIRGITRPEKVRELLRKHVEAARDKKRVRHVDIDGGIFE